MLTNSITTTFTKFTIASDSDLYGSSEWKTTDANYDVGFYYGSGTYNVACYNFMSPSFSGRSLKIKVTLKVGNGYTYGDSFDVKINYAICTSDANKNLYRNTSTSVSDKYQIVSGVWNLTALPYDIVDREIIIETSEFKPDTSYYLFLWAAEEKNSCCGFRSHYNYVKSGVIDINYLSANACIYNGDDYLCAITYIDNGSEYIYATPYICVQKHEDWEGLFQATVSGSLNLRDGPGTSYSKVATLPNGAVVTVYDIAKGDDGYVWAQMTYGNYEGWCSTRYLTYTAYAHVTNQNGARQYGFGPANTVEYSNVFPYGSEVTISTDNSGSDLALRQAEDYDGTEVIIWCHTIFSGKHEDGSVFNVDGYVKLSDIELLSERTVFEWKKAIA